MKINNNNKKPLLILIFGKGKQKSLGVKSFKFGHSLLRKVSFLSSSLRKKKSNYIWHKNGNSHARFHSRNHFCKCQEEKCPFSATLFDCIAKWESWFPSSSSLFLAALMMTNMTHPSSNCNFRDDKCALHFSRSCLRLSSQPAKYDSGRRAAARLRLAGFEWRPCHSLENSVKNKAWFTCVINWAHLSVEAWQVFIDRDC